MEEHINSINNLFEMGLGHTFKDMLGSSENQNIDWSKLQYNALYRDYSFYERKFPKGYKSIPGFNNVIQKIAEKNKDNSPLKEICQLQMPLSCREDDATDDNNFQVIYKEGDECNKQISDYIE